MISDIPAPLGAVLYDDTPEGDALIAQIADRLIADGLSVAGVVHTNPVQSDNDRCGMELRELHSGAIVNIALDLGGAPGCKLNPAALLEAAVLVERALQTDPDLVVLNKFGKQEASGGGLREVLSNALLAGVPVLLGVSQLNLEACKQFAGDCFVALPCDADAVVAWCAKEAASRRRQRVQTAQPQAALGGAPA